MVTGTTTSQKDRPLTPCFLLSSLESSKDGTGSAEPLGVSGFSSCCSAAATQNTTPKEDGFDLVQFAGSVTPWELQFPAEKLRQCKQKRLLTSPHFCSVSCWAAGSVPVPRSSPPAGHTGRQAMGLVTPGHTGKLQCGTQHRGTTKPLGDFMSSRWLASTTKHQ